MFPAGHFAPVYFAPRYFAKIGGLFTAPIPGRAAVVVTGRNQSAKAEVSQ